MKRAYWFLLLFAVWCLACAIWYMFAVKGIPSDLANFHPHPRLQAIFEVLLMLLVACLIGYGIGWALRDGPLDALRETLEQSENEREEGLKEKNHLLQQLELLKSQLIHTRHMLSENAVQSGKAHDSLKEELKILQQESEKLRAAKPVAEMMEIDLKAARLRLQQLEVRNRELDDKVQKLKGELEIAHHRQMKSEVEPLHPFVRPIPADEKDDLTQIKGIGPFIEKRLNMVGIYTLRQISEFTPDIMEQISKAIEFFPHRMVRDNWIGQAKLLLEESGS